MHAGCGKKVSMAKPCARSDERHTICAGCVVHKSKNPGRSPACIYFTVADGFDYVKWGWRGGPEVVGCRWWPGDSE